MQKLGYDGHSALGSHKQGVQEPLQPLLQPLDTSGPRFIPSSRGSSKLRIQRKQKKTTSKITPFRSRIVSIKKQPIRSKHSSHESIPQLQSLHTKSKQRSYVVCQTITPRIKILSTSDTPTTLTTSSDKIPAVAIDKPFTSANILITYNNRVLPSDSAIDSCEYKWGSLASHES